MAEDGARCRVQAEYSSCLSTATPECGLARRVSPGSSASSGERGRGFWRLPQLGKCSAPGPLGCLVPSCRPSRRRAPDCEVPGSVEETKEAGQRRGGGRTGAGRRAPRTRSSSPHPHTESPAAKASSLGTTQVLSSSHKRSHSRYPSRMLCGSSSLLEKEEREKKLSPKFSSKETGALSGFQQKN